MPPPSSASAAGRRLCASLCFAASRGGFVCIAPVLSGQIHSDPQRDEKKGLMAVCICLHAFLLCPPLNYLQLDCHSDGLHLPCINRRWRFPETLQAMANVCLCPAPFFLRTNSASFHVFVRLFYDTAVSNHIEQISA